MNTGEIKQKWFVNGKACHHGIDISTPVGTDVYAIAGGSVTTRDEGEKIGFGKYVIVDHGLSIYPQSGVYSVYGHLSNYGSTGSVSEGAVIGKSGNTGRSTAPHLHFSIFIADTSRPLFKNGTFNCDASVDPESFFWTRRLD